jgi:hypothetical protein
MPIAKPASSSRSALEGAEWAQPAEVELLLHCARLDLLPVGRQRIPLLLTRPLDWGLVLDLAQRHGLMPLLFRHLSSWAPSLVPKEVFVQLWAIHAGHVRRNLAMARELSEILRLLEANGIPALAYKGPALADFVYGDVALREFGDLDILIRSSDMSAARTLLEAAGYEPKYRLTPNGEAAYMDSDAQYHIALLHSVREVMVELHWKTDPEFPVEAVAGNSWWSDLNFVQFQNARIRCFSNEELLLVLCLHGTKHAWASLGWLVDVSELIRKHPVLDWDWTLEKAVALHCQRRFALGLFLAFHLLDAPLPIQVQSQIARQKKLRRLATAILSAAFVAPPSQPSALEALRFNLRLCEGLGQRAAHCRNVMLMPSLHEWSKWPLPRPLFAFYVPLRLGRLAHKYTVALLHMLGRPRR